MEVGFVLSLETVGFGKTFEMALWVPHLGEHL